MVSAPSALAPAPPPRAGSLAPERWPRSTAGRNVVRAALALPLIVVAVIADRRGVSFPLNEALLARAEVVRDGGPDLSSIDLAYPPVPTLLAILFPSALALSIAGAVAAAIAVHAITERVVRRRVDPWLVVVLVMGGAAVPAVWYGVMGELETVLGLMFLTLAFGAFVRFAFEERTEGGFLAGLALAAAFTCTAVALVYAVALALAAPTLARHRYRGQPYAAQATVAVLCFPVVAAYLGWTFLAWRFSGATLGTLGIEAPELFDFADGVLGTLVEAFRQALVDTVRTPVYVVVGVLLFLRRPLGAIGYLIPIAGLVVVRWLGVPFDDVAAFALLALVAGATVPYRPRGAAAAALAVAAVAQLAINVVWPPYAPGLDQWLDAMF